MCGRFALFADIKSIMKYADMLGGDFDLHPHYNISPGMNIPLLIRSNDHQTITTAKWGFVPHFITGTPKFNVINAKAETIEEKGMFKHSFHDSRCLIPANGFYEWRAADKQPFFISLKDYQLCFFAGIYSHRQASEEASCAIITTAANNLIQPIHQRMPVIIHNDKLYDYLFQKEENRVKDMLVPYPAEGMKMIPVSREVNNARNNNHALIEAIEEQNDLF